MSRARDPAREKAREMWEISGKSLKLCDIAAQLKIPEATVRAWKSKDRWNTESFQKKERSASVKDTERSDEKRNAPNGKLVLHHTSSTINQTLIEALGGNDNLTEKQKDFCLHFVHTYNATRAYQKAYGCSYDVAGPNSSRLLRKDNILSEISRLKQMKRIEIMMDENDLVEMHMKIAFSDITDFLEFGREEVAVMARNGPLEIKDKETGENMPVTKVINTVRFRESSEVDGRIISEIKQGKDGASVKLADRQKSLSFLERWFTANPMDKHKIAYEDAKIQLEREKFEESKAVHPSSRDSIQEAGIDPYESLNTDELRRLLEYAKKEN